MSDLNHGDGVDPSHDWYAVYVRSRHEAVVAGRLRGRGLPVFSPSYRLRCRRQGRTLNVDHPLFPGYVFCQFDLRERLGVLQTSGVVHIIGRGKDPEPVCKKEIATIQSMVGSGLPVQPQAYLRPGQRVRVVGGPLAGVEGTLLRTKGADLLVASIALLQRAVAVELMQDEVQPLY